MLKSVLLIALFLSALFPSTLDAQETGKYGPFEPDEELLGKIEELEDHTWMKLPRVKVAGDVSWLHPQSAKRKFGPQGRSYCNHAYWAPDRKTALFCGGGHNTNRINDVWEYDLASNTWICLKGSDPSCTYTEEWFKENGRFSSNGVVIHKSGGFIWHLNHSWDQVEYDPDRELLLFIHSLPRSIRNSGSLLKEGNPVQKGLGMTHEEFQKKLCKDGIYIWPFDPTTRIWQEPEFLANFKRPGNTIGGRQESAMLEYIHDRKTLAFEGAYFSLILNRDSGEWVETKGSRGTTKFTGAYVPHLKKLVAFRGKKTQVRGVDDKRWTTVREDGPIVHTSFSAANYDPVSGKILLFNGGKKGPYLWAYDPINNAWENPPQKGDVPGSPINSQKMLIYQDHARNVMVFDSGKEVRVYRYKKQ